jgi:transcription initiation factor TFIID subunit 7
MKVADIHQMLLVLGRVENDEQAKNYELPSSVDKINHQFAHGLTPPMHYVRKRRFRKRVSHRTIEAVEEEVERLLAADEDARKNGGLSEYQMLDPNARDDSEDREQSDEADAYGEEVQDSIEADAYGEEDDEMARLMAEEFEKDPHALPGMLLSGDGDIHASPDTLHPTETPASAMSPSDDSSDAESEIEIDDDERELQQERAQQREEIDDIKNEIASVDKQLQGQQNLLLRTRLTEKKQKLNRDLQLKLANLGEEE